ncbi:MAG TPA: cytochrome c biogenesis protein CcdA [Lacisediminihabitans sp.]|uniref:cytochrome c biogenesis CcdA family protein n=1 Tax=Lacisediminihabitans sp. TaxID=2787631 RepID=UPI002ED89123
MGQLLLSSTILASFLGGVVALFAPCCVSVMLPAFFASSFQRRSQILWMTVVFAAGVGTIILPIALGAALISRALAQYHFWIFGAVGLLMMAAGIATFAGWKMMLPMPSGSGSGGKGIGSVYGLGVFSGAASACCAPVLAGVAAMSGAASSFPAAAISGIAYVFGMVAPLCILALVWDRRDWGKSALFTGRTIPVGRGRRLPIGTVLSAVIMLAMGILTVVIAVRGPGMSADGWQVQITAFLGHVAAVVQQSLSFLPGWLTALIVLVALVAVVWAAVRSRSPQASGAATDPPEVPSADHHHHHDHQVTEETK